jgi:hypothetical protein
MSNFSKTKILSVLLFLMLSIPTFLNPISEGEVKGVTEEKSQNLQNSIISKNSNSEKGQISAGVIEDKTDKKTTKIVNGMAILKTNANNPVTTDNYDLATSLKVTHKNKTLDLVVNDTKPTLDPDGLIVVNSETFQKLGGDPQTQTKIPISVHSK